MTYSRSQAASPYMEFAKLRSAAPYNLATSGVMSYPLAELPVRLADLEPVRLLDGVGDVLLAPVDPLGEERVAGQRELRVVGERGARGDLVVQRAGGVGEDVRERRLRVGGARLRAGDAEPDRLLAAGRDGHVVGELAARALAVGRVVARLLRRRGVLAGRPADLRARWRDVGRHLLRAPEAAKGMVLVVDILMPWQEGRPLHLWLGMTTLVPAPFAVATVAGWI